MHYREACLNDLPVLLALEQYIIETERPLDPLLKSEGARYYDLEALITHTDSVVMVAEENDEIIATGYAKICQSEPWYAHDYHTYLGFMYVAEQYRGQGLNQDMMTILKDWSQNKGIHHLYLEVYTDKAHAIRAYEKAGFTPHVLEMRLNLDD
ncbi:putative acetyltransferase [Vibrio aerogenes CECT 7868]|uniref:Putative acetyltransferase n=1 Tax=Vibrio aerogenes CECT 7868 TaxID=1216006 RepID=A0A1M5VGJ8_9VIBR|nr:GNAT family N-acetyltransferase [Vibrio aerogenes]SHH74278.1 putative acetyltransferase [Vibrio aerogenes CECT 7868]